MNGLRFSNRRKSDKINLEEKKIENEKIKNININYRKSVPIFSSIKNKVQNDNKEKIEQEGINQNINDKKPINLIKKINKIEDENNYKKNENELMDNIFNEVEKFNAKNILKGDLADIYKEIVKDNMDFKENIFFVNLNHYENSVGNCDNEVVQHSFKEYKKEELLKNKYLPSKELYNKYDKKAKIIKEKNEF